MLWNDFSLLSTILFPVSHLSYKCYHSYDKSQKNPYLKRRRSRKKSTIFTYIHQEEEIEKKERTTNFERTKN